MMTTGPTNESRGTRRRSAARLRTGALLLAVPLFVSACSGSPTGKPVVAAAPPPAMSIVVSPASTDKEVTPDDAVKVRAVNGTLADVQVMDSEGEALRGTFDDERTLWTATDRVQLAERYSVRVIGVDLSETRVREASTFSTADIPESDRLYASTISPLDGMTVGVAQPLVVGFNHAVRDKALIQEALRVETSPQVEGAWYWIDDRYVNFRPKEFWPANTKVTLKADIAGLKAAPGLWGGANRSISYQIGREQIIKVNVKNHKMKVIGADGATIKTFPVSTGKPGWETRNGIKVLMEKVRHKKWTNEAINAPEFYRLQSSYAMRMTNSGEFIHDAPWNTGNIGSDNTSHGCVGLTVSNMAWLYANSIMGDPIIVTGSPRKYTNLLNRYADWNISWERWSAGNADKAYL